jgi:hypothetical protein
MANSIIPHRFTSAKAQTLASPGLLFLSTLHPPAWSSIACALCTQAGGFFYD